MKTKFTRRILLVFMCLLLMFGLVNFTRTVKAEDAIINPDAPIDIVVNVPADYPGTFLDFKDELTEKLVTEGLDESKFRIISSAVKIDTTDTSGWYVYDHYNSQNDYNKLKLDASKQPFRLADNSYATGANPTTIEKEFATTTPTTTRFFERHIASSQDKAGKAKMTFAGYGKEPYADFMIYPAASDSRRTFSFDIDAKYVGNHTLTGTGFFVNAGISGTGNSAAVTGYLLFYEFSTQTSGNIYLIPMTNINAMNFNTASVTSLYSSAIAKDTFSLGAEKRARIDVDLQSTSITVQQRNYTTSGTFEATQNLFKDKGSSVPMNSTGYNGFGPMVAYRSHGCSQLTSFVFSDLEMNYEAGAFDALRNVQYSDKADYKYFVNLAGTSGDPGIPEYEEGYLEGVTRLKTDNIFYISNVDDGRVLSEPTSESTGLSPDNGLYATDADYVTQIAKYITDNYNDKVQYKDVKFLKEKNKPIANFIISDAQTNSQVLTVHLQHLKTSNSKVTVKITDRSLTADDGKPINAWRLKIYDPDNTVVKDSGGFKTSVSELPTYEFSKDAKQGKYTFELTVRDTENRESTIFQTYLTSYLDDQPAAITAESQGKASKAEVTLKDQGYGIDSDGVTLKSNVGSGVVRYQVGDGEVVTLKEPEQTHSFTTPLGKESLKVTSWDECGNESTKTFDTVEVSFKDNENDPYYILKGRTLGELPPGPEKENNYFQGWAKEDNTIVSSDTVVNEDIVLHPVYTTETVNLTFNAGGGKFTEGEGTKQITVPKGSKVIDKLLTGDSLPSREGYVFTGWKINNQDVKDQSADSNTTITAQWKKDNFQLIFDANGGVLGRLKSKSVEFEKPIEAETKTDQAGNPYQGTSLPTKEGYIFEDWAKDTTGTAIGSDKMPASDYTVYAKWRKDTSKFIVSFDSAGGSPVTDKSYATSTQKYGKLSTPSRSGYTFTGWYDENGGERKSEGDVYNTSDHKLTARWTANPNTQYKIEYYFNSPTGYIRDDQETVIKHGTTDTEVQTSEEDIKNVDGYWFDEGNSGNVRKATIGGDGRTTMKLYYNRYLTVSGEADGEGSVQTTGTIKEGESAKATWAPAEGYVVNKVTVDGIVRYDLTDKNSIDWTNLSENHTVSVKFVKKNASGVGENVNDNGYYQVRTKVEGPYNSCDITPTMTVKKGAAHTVNWTVKDGYYVSSVNIDGREYTPQTAKTDFKNIRGDHDVVITTKPYDRIGGNTAKGNYTITVNRYGGNATDTLVSGSCVAEPGDDKDVTWSATNGWKVVNVLVDGKSISKEDYNKMSVLADTDVNGLHNFNNIQANHVVDVYFDKEAPARSTPKETVTVQTQLIGGPGDITAGAVLEKGSDYTVNWDFAKNKGYVIDHVELNGQTIEPKGNSYDFKNLTDNQNVKVYIKPVTYNINVLTYGNGTVSESKTLYPGQNYDISGTPEAGNKISRLVVDGVEVPLDGTQANVPGVGVTNATETGMALNVSNISGDHNVEIYFTNQEGSKNDIPAEDELTNISAEFVGGTGTVKGTGIVKKGASKTVSWNVDDGYEVTDVTVNGERKSLAGSELLLSDIQDKANVKIYITKRLPGDVEILDIDPNDAPQGESYEITTEIVGGPGTITNSTQVGKDGNHTVNWKITEKGYIPTDIKVDGVSRPDLINYDGEGNILFENVGEGHTVTVILGKDPVNVDLDGDGNPDINIDINGDRKPDINIDINGDNQPDLNIDTNKDGTPDLNIDTNDDGRPDVNIDTNGDGKADLNVDINGDGIADLNIDTNGDGIADLNIDADGDGIIDKDPSLYASSVKTGDTTDIILWIVAAAAAVAGIASTIVYNRKRR